jgi:hypothetical protein
LNVAGYKILVDGIAVTSSGAGWGATCAAASCVSCSSSVAATCAAAAASSTDPGVNNPLIVIGATTYSTTTTTASTSNVGVVGDTDVCKNVDGIPARSTYSVLDSTITPSATDIAIVYKVNAIGERIGDRECRGACGGREHVYVRRNSRYNFAGTVPACVGGQCRQVRV